MLLSAALLATCLAYGGGPPPRGNTALDPERRVWSVAVTTRLGLLIGGGDVLFARRPPVGFGFGLQLKYHALRVGPLRFGFEFQGGHTRFLERARHEVPPMAGDPVDPATGQPELREVTRVSALAHTDLAIGPSLQIVARVLLIDVSAGGGLMISSWRRARSANAWEDYQAAAYDPLLRAGVSFGVPIRKNHGLALGVDFQKAFSRTRVVVDPTAPPGSAPEGVVFDMLLNVNLAYQAWF